MGQMCEIIKQVFLNVAIQCSITETDTTKLITLSITMAQPLRGSPS